MIFYEQNLQFIISDVIFALDKTADGPKAAIMKNTAKAFGNSPEKDRPIRRWDFNTNQQILNIHYADGGQQTLHVSPRRMRTVFKIRNANPDSRLPEHAELRKIAAEAAEMPRVAPQPRMITAEDERFWMLHTQKRLLGINGLTPEDKEEYLALLNRTGFE